jgi:hypothetical protein
MRRALSRVSLVISLTLAVLFAALWIRSYWFLDGANFYPIGAMPTQVCLFKLECSHGGIVWEWTSEFDGAAGGRFIKSFSVGQREIVLFSQPGIVGDYSYLESKTLVNRGGFYFDTFGARSGWHGGTIAFPLWAPLILLLILPVIQVTKFLRRRRARGLNCCRNCGYDLRATPLRCPECGTTPLAT